MELPILQGVYTDKDSDFRVAYPRNLLPVPQAQGVGISYLKPAPGVVAGAIGPGTDRGGINWDGICYRVMGTKLVSVASDFTITELGDVGTGGQVTLDYSFDRLAIVSGTNLYYYDGSSLVQVTDPDLGIVLDMVWVDGYFMTTDGEFIVVTDIGDPLSVNPLKYGSAEADPDPIKALVKLRNEVYALNRYTIEAFDNIGGSAFPFQRIEGAQIQRGVIGTHACTIYRDAIAFVGSARNEQPSVWVGANGQAVKISTREIDLLLLDYTEAALALTVVQSFNANGQDLLYIRLPDKTLVYDADASKSLQQSVWHVLTSGLTGSQLRIINRVWAYDLAIVGDPESHAVGCQTQDVSTHWDHQTGWEFSTSVMYNAGAGGIIHELELIALTGNAKLGVDPTLWTSYSVDGQTWSQEKFIKAGKQGERNKRLLWLQQGTFRSWRVQRFKGTSDAQLTFARLEAKIEAMAW